MHTYFTVFTSTRFGNMPSFDRQKAFEKLADAQAHAAAIRANVSSLTVCRIDVDARLNETKTIIE